MTDNMDEITGEITGEDDDYEVEAIKAPNKLKIKITGSESSGPGKIDEEAIAQADQFIEDMCAECPKFIGKAVDRLMMYWDEMKSTDDAEELQDLTNKVFTQAHEVKDIGGMCGYTLISDFGESLRDYIKMTTLSHDAHRVIIQAHVDVIRIAGRELIRDDGGPQAQELKTMLRTAIEKYK